MSLARKGKPTKPHTQEYKDDMRAMLLANNPMKGKFGDKHHLFGTVGANKGKKVKRTKEAAEAARKRMVLLNQQITVKRDKSGKFVK